MELIGGLGNQMFQYAFGRQMAELNGTKLQLDLFALKHANVTTPREYTLDVFNIRAEQAQLADVRRYNPHVQWRPVRKFRSLLGLRSHERQPGYVREPSDGFDPSLLDHRGNLYLSGYWQSEKYFLGVADLIREEFVLKEAKALEELDIAREIREVESVSLHVRRGDYVTDARTNSHHGTCSLDYYAEAVRRISAQVSEPHILVFSDDPQWVLGNLETDCPLTVVSGSDLKDYEELTLMSWCKHNIIANSSFSWWGAWLNDNPDKIVVAPKNWFNASDPLEADRVPESWVRL